MPYIVSIIIVIFVIDVLCAVLGSTEDIAKYAPCLLHSTALQVSVGMTYMAAMIIIFRSAFVSCYLLVLSHLWTDYFVYYYSVNHFVLLPCGSLVCHIHEVSLNDWFFEERLQLASATLSFNPLDSKGNYSATSNNMKLVHWPLMGGLLHLVQQGGDWAPLCCARCNSPPINGQCTSHYCYMMVRCSAILMWRLKGSGPPEMRVQCLVNFIPHSRLSFSDFFVTPRVLSTECDRHKLLMTLTLFAALDRLYGKVEWQFYRLSKISH